jgi:hypothetical protein
LASLPACSYTAKELSLHCREGEPESGFNGHPLCKLCDRRFYGETELIEHLTRDHFNCHICPRHGPPGAPTPQRVFYAAYSDLARHFGRRHWACAEPDCVATHFVVFETSLELQVGRVDR